MKFITDLKESNSRRVSQLDALSRRYKKFDDLFKTVDPEEVLFQLDQVKEDLALLAGNDDFIEFIHKNKNIDGLAVHSLMNRHKIISKLLKELDYELVIDTSKIQFVDFSKLGANNE